MTKEELLAEEYICNGKCQDDITRNYVHCKTCTRLKDFLAGYKAGKADFVKENAELKTDYEVLSCSVGDFGELQNKLEEEQRKNNGLSDNLTTAKELLKQWLSLCGFKVEKLAKDTEQFISEVEE